MFSSDYHFSKLLLAMVIGAGCLSALLDIQMSEVAVATVGFGIKRASAGSQYGICCKHLIYRPFLR